MGMPAIPNTGWTVDMLETLPDDGKRYEIIEGELFVTPAPNLAHQRVVGAMYRRLHAHLERSTVGEVILSPADVRSGPRTSVQPDVFVVRRPVGLGRHGWPDLDTLLLALEVLSPSTARADRGAKRQLYQRASVTPRRLVASH
jgi:Uma2 family endonuclease